MIKISGPEKAVLALMAAFFVFAGGYFLGGRGSGDSYAVAVQTMQSSRMIEAVSMPASPEVVNINTATAQQLETLPGIGAVRAQAIVADREANGPFRFPEDLMRVSGIGPGTLSEILNYITVE